MGTIIQNFYITGMVITAIVVLYSYFKDNCKKLDNALIDLDIKLKAMGTTVDYQVLALIFMFSLMMVVFSFPIFWYHKFNNLKC